MAAKKALPSKDELRLAFAENQKEQAKVAGKIEKLRKQQQEYIDQIHAARMEKASVDAEIRDLELNTLAPLKADALMMSSALNGRTGIPARQPGDLAETPAE